MNSFRNSNNRKIQDIVKKLQKLDCTLPGNADAAWIEQLLFKPGCHRYQLMDWVFSRFESSSKLSGNQNSDEEKILKDLETLVEELGFNKKISHELVKGTASIDEQLKFWSVLVDLLSMKYDIINTNSHFSESEDTSSSLEKSKYIYEEYKSASLGVENVVKNVNLRNLFKHDLQLLPPYMEKEMDTLPLSKLQKYPFLSLQTMKDEIRKEPHLVSKDLYSTALSNKILVIENKADEEELDQLENSMLEVSNLLQDCAKGKFCEVYNELETLTLHVAPEEFVDIGPHFQKVDENLEKLLELQMSLHRITSANSKHLQINSQLEDLSSIQSRLDSESYNISKLLKEDLY